MLILCDIHSTLFDSDTNRVNLAVVSVLKGLQSNHEICLITARVMNLTQKNAMIEQLKKSEKLTVKNIYCPTATEADKADDIKIKQFLLNKIMEERLEPILTAIDNRKDVCKMYRHHNIDSFRFKASEGDE